MMNVIRVLCVVIFCTVCLSRTVKAEVIVSTDVVHYNWNGHNEMMGIVSANTDYGTSFYYCGYVEADFSRKEDDLEVEGIHGFSSYICETTWFQKELSLSYTTSSDYEVTGSPFLETVYTEDDDYI